MLLFSSNWPLPVQLSFFKLLTVMWRTWRGFCCLYRIVFEFSHIERCIAPGNDRNMEYIHDSLEGFVEIIVAFFLVPANVQGFMGIKVLTDDLLHSLQELLNHIKDKIAASLQVSVEFRSVNLLAKEVH